MVKLQLTLKSDKPNFVHALNGKSFKLQPGANTLILDYDDYVSLAAALGIKPIENEVKQDTEHTHDECSDTIQQFEQTGTSDETLDESLQETLDESLQEVSEQSINDETVEAIDSAEQETIENTDAQSLDDESEDDTESNTELVETEAKNESVDYSSWSISRLKSKYKSITGKTCKLKKDEIIEFLQNKDNDSDV